MLITKWVFWYALKGDGNSGRCYKLLFYKRTLFISARA